MQGKSHKFHMNAKTKDTWVKQGQTWMFKRSEVLENHVEIVGKRRDGQIWERRLRYE